jgi:hypothetical protein
MCYYCVIDILKTFPLIFVSKETYTSVIHLSNLRDFIIQIKLHSRLDSKRDFIIKCVNFDNYILFNIKNFTTQQHI